MHMHAEHNDTIKTSDTVLRKIYLSLYMKGLCVRGSCWPNRTATYWPPLLWPSVFLSRSPGQLNREPVDPASLSAGFLYRILSLTRLIPNSPSGAWGPTLLGAAFLYRILSPTDWISCALSYIIVQRPPSCGRHNRTHSTCPRSRLYSDIPRTGCTCYLHRCISYFDSPAGSEVNMQQ